MKKYLFFYLLFTTFFSFSQTKKINVLNSDNTMVSPEYPNAIILLGNVNVEHEGATIRCDKAYLYQSKRLIKGMGNVIVNQGDTVYQYSKYIDYDGMKKYALSWGDVELKDELKELKTDTLRFNRNEQKLYYNTGGTLKDTANVLISKIGNYNLQNKKFEAQKNVVVTNKDGSKLNSNHLDYYANTGIAKILGASTITNENNKIYTEEGTHNTKTKISNFVKNSVIYFKDRTIKGDSLHYNKNTEFASATGNIKVTDTINNTIVKGGYAEYFKLKDSLFVTKKAVAIYEIDKDSMYIHGKKLELTGKTENRIVKAYNHVKIYKSDLQAKCDSLISYENTGITKLLINPVVWAKNNQITADSIHLISNTKTEQLDSLKILGKAFMVSKDSLGYNQLKGKNMYGKFLNNDLKQLDVIGNSETIYFSRNDKQELIGITQKQASKKIVITFDKKEIQLIDFIEKPDGKTYPYSKWQLLHEQEKKLKNFIWRKDEQPKTIEDIFIWNKKNSTKENANKL